jgi:hypothetical protein
MWYVADLQGLHLTGSLAGGSGGTTWFSGSTKKSRSIVCCKSVLG